MTEEYDPARAECATAKVMVCDDGAAVEVEAVADDMTPVGLVVRTDTVTLRTYLADDEATDLALQLTDAVESDTETHNANGEAEEIVFTSEAADP